MKLLRAIRSEFGIRYWDGEISYGREEETEEGKGRRAIDFVFVFVFG